MRDQSDMMIEKQAELISKLRADNAQLQQKLDQQYRDIERLRMPARFYNDLQKQILENPTLQSEWERFLTFLKMSGEEDYLKETGAFS
jgi:hypothetical protein